MRKKLISLVLVLLLLVVGVVGCGAKKDETEKETEAEVEDTEVEAEDTEDEAEDTEDEAEETEAEVEEDTESEETAESGDIKDEYTFEVVSKGFQSTYWQAVLKGFEKGVADLEAEHNIKINYNFIGPDSESDTAVQKQQFESAVNVGPDALGLAAIDTNALLDPVQKALDENIPIIGFDSGVPDAPEGAIYANASTDNYVAGGIAADGLYEKVKDRLGEGSVIGLVAQDTTSESVVSRGVGFIDRIIELLTEDDLTVFVIGNEKYVSDSKDSTAASESEADVIINARAAAQTTVELCATEATVLLNDPNIVGIFGSNQVAAEGIISANTNLNVTGSDDDQIIAVGFDSGSVIKENVSSGVMYGAVTQAPVAIGEITAKLMFDVSNGVTVEDTDTGAQFYTAENIESEEIAQNLYD